MGPKHPLKTQCFVEGARYAFDAKIKLLDENGAPFACDKSHTWVDEKSCPILTFQVQDSNGKSWSYYGNEVSDEWNADIWNPFNTFFEITPQMANSIDSYFYIERPRAGITIIIDQVVISRDCTKLVTHGDAEVSFIFFNIYIINYNINICNEINRIVIFFFLLNIYMNFNISRMDLQMDGL